MRVNEQNKEKSECRCREIRAAASKKKFVLFFCECCVLDDCVLRLKENVVSNPFLCEPRHQCCSKSMTYSMIQMMIYL